MHPILYEFAGVTVHTYGACVALSLLVLVGWARFAAPRRGLDFGIACDIVFAFFVSGIAGGRLLFAAEHPDLFSTDWLRLFRIQEGGLSWYGAFVVGATAAIATAKLKKQPVLVWADFFAAPVALAHAIGRIGCYFNGCCQARAGVELILPLQILESLGLVMICACLCLIGSGKTDQSDCNQRRPGLASATYLIFYGILRFVLDSYRQDRLVLSSYSLAQWVSAVFVIIGTGLLINRAAKTRRLK
ncbi:MAG: prolipoprotein diacylglyceryl transferase family protein [Candidatus Omnitrophota bacterium]